MANPHSGQSKTSFEKLRREIESESRSLPILTLCWAFKKHDSASCITFVKYSSTIYYKIKIDIQPMYLWIWEDGRCHLANLTRLLKTCIVDGRTFVSMYINIPSFKKWKNNNLRTAGRWTLGAGLWTTRRFLQFYNKTKLDTTHSTALPIACLCDEIHPKQTTILSWILLERCMICAT